MARISVLGGTGYGGSHIVREAARRGHQVTSYSRSTPDQPIDGVTYVSGSVLESVAPDGSALGIPVLKQSVIDADVVFEALSPRGELEGKVEQVVEQLIELATSARVRLGVLGGASSLQVSPGGPRFIDLNPPPAELRSEIQTGINVLEILRGSADELDWFYISPAVGFGVWAPGEATGRYRVSDEVLLVDENGDSNISGADLATAIVDEIENPVHGRQRFHVAY